MDKAASLLLSLVAGGIIFWLLLRKLQGQITDNNNISNSTVIIGHPAVLSLSALLPAQRAQTTPTREFKLPTARTPMPLPTVTRTDGYTISANGRAIVAPRNTRTSVTITNGSPANLIRVGSKAEVIRGEGAIIPPHGVVSFPLREQTELWARANGSTQAGVIVSEA